MPRDDRDQNFDKALARQLGSSRAVQGNDCLDAETLAAYHERLLDPEEMAQRKSHIASCERCQEILAQLEATDAIPVEADRDLLLDQIVLEIPESASAPAGAAAPTEPNIESEAKLQLEEVPSPVDAAPQKSETPATPAPEAVREFEIEHDPDLVAASAAPPSLTQSQSPSLVSAAPKAPLVGAKTAAAGKSAAPSSATITFRSPREDRPKLVRFVALAGALAAGLIFWVVFRNQNESVNIAQNHQQKLEMPPQSPAPVPSADEKSAASASQSSESNEARQQPAAPRPSAQPPRDQSKSPGDSIDNSLDAAKETLDKAKSIEQKSRKDASGASATFIPRQEESDAASSAIAGRVARSGRTAAPTSPRNVVSASPVDKALADAKAALQSTSNSPSTIPATPPPARTKMNPGVVTEAATVSRGASGLAQVSDSGAAANGRMVNTLSTRTPLSVPAPSGKTIWRIGQAGQIQRSADSGATWAIQPSGVVADLIAGSAYSDQVCWLVGRNGTILRTTNGGATWQKVASPSNVDLLGVFSINADSATITDAAGRAFETTSAGSHWTRTRLQQ